jgi:hypothetical protein
MLELIGSVSELTKKRMRSRRCTKVESPEDWKQLDKLARDLSSTQVPAFVAPMIGPKSNIQLRNCSLKKY